MSTVVGSVETEVQLTVLESAESQTVSLVGAVTVMACATATRAAREMAL